MSRQVEAATVHEAFLWREKREESSLERDLLREKLSWVIMVMTGGWNEAERESRNHHRGWSRNGPRQRRWLCP
jgi:hypothetical protein